MKKNIILFILWVCGSLCLRGQELKTKNLSLITLDGLRWQEIFFTEVAPRFSLIKQYVKDNRIRHPDFFFVLSAYRSPYFGAGIAAVASEYICFSAP
jgi:hypothetical protein